MAGEYDELTAAINAAHRHLEWIAATYTFPPTVRRCTCPSDAEIDAAIEAATTHLTGGTK